ncbi:MAG: hypothetical protein FD156_1783 [Nitrospirae bacterium]|nr:MAG: hypothetical protein FD156_1783 [Nitrospirota bacterium]
MFGIRANLTVSNTIMKKQKNKFDFLPYVVILFVILSYGRIFWLRDVFWDDNCWLLSEFSSLNLDQFLNTGFYEMRRAPLGIFFYYFFSLHKATGHAYLIWHSMNMIIQILTPVFLYFFLKNLFKDKQLLSFFIAASLVVFSLDNTLPYLSAINYRIAILLAVISFYLTERAFGRDNPWFLLVISLLISGLSYYVFMEAAIVFEPARLFVIGYIFHKKGLDGKSLIKKSLKYFLPFFLLCIPLVLYKLTYKSYGIYGGKYKTDIFFFLRWKEHAKLIGIFLFYQWKVLSGYIKDVKIWTLLISFLATCIGFFAVKKLPGIIRDELSNPNMPALHSFKKEFKRVWYHVRIVFFVGIAFLAPAVLFMEFARLEIGPGFNSSHFTLLQIGYAIIIGCILFTGYSVFLNSYGRVRLLGLSLVLIIGAGIFFNNLNLDMYFNSRERQARFWKSFTKRFPSLPENTIFMMDARDPYYYDTPDLDNTYDLEYMLNLLYADSDKPEEFRKYKVLAFEEFKPEMVQKFRCDHQMNEEKMERMTHFGKETLDPCKFIVVYYRNGELLVNREIKEKYPDILYRMWLNNDFPELPDKPANYALRHKLREIR